jgi:hypothetical protein
MRLSLLFFTFLLISSNLEAKCAARPSFMLDVEILSCKVMYFEGDKLNNSVLLTVQVNDEIPFGTSSPMNWEVIKATEPYSPNYSIKGKKIPLLFLDNGYSCSAARSSKLYYEGKSVFFAQSLCCDTRTEICEQTNLIGHKPPNFWDFPVPLDEFDPKWDFNQDDIIKE